MWYPLTVSVLKSIEKDNVALLLQFSNLSDRFMVDGEKLVKFPVSPFLISNVIVPGGFPIFPVHEWVPKLVPSVHL